MKKICFISLSLLLSLSTFAQTGKEVNSDEKKGESNSRFQKRKEKGFYNTMQVSFLFSQSTSRPSYMPVYEYSSSSYIISPPVYYSDYRPKLRVVPSFTITNGYMFNKHLAAGAGVGYEAFNYNLFPLFAEIRYTVWDGRISPFVVLKSGYSFGGLRSKHFDDLYFDWSPYYVHNARLRNYGGFMLHPEVGVKIPLNENSDMLLTAAYRYQKTRSIARREGGQGQYDEWEHKEDSHWLTFGIGIMFR